MEKMEINYTLPSKEFWQGKKVLLTGHTGFKGSWLTFWLNRMGADITGISLEPNTTPNLYSLLNIEKLCESIICDIRDKELLKSHIHRVQPEIIFHLAAQPLVRESYDSPLETFSINTLGTANLLDSLINLKSLKSVVVITTDKVYFNNEWDWPYREEDRLGGYDPYSASKAASELILESYKKSFFLNQGLSIASARAGNVIGGGDWSKDRLIPDAIKAWQNNKKLIIRSPNSIRPWQHVLDPLCGYILLAENLYNTKITDAAFNFGPLTHEAATVSQIVEKARKLYGYGLIEYVNDCSNKHEAGLLTLDIAKSIKILNHYPRWHLNIALEKSILWYKNLKNGLNACDLCNLDIDSFEKYYE